MNLVYFLLYWFIKHHQAAHGPESSRCSTIIRDNDSVTARSSRASHHKRTQRKYFTGQPGHDYGRVDTVLQHDTCTLIEVRASALFLIYLIEFVPSGVNRCNETNRKPFACLATLLV